MIKKTVSIFGSTGSIGKNTVEILSDKHDSYRVICLVANKNVATLIKQARFLQPNYAVIADINLYSQLKEGLQDLPQIEVLAGMDAVNQVSAIKCDIFICAIVGMAALIPTVKAIEAGSNIALANKECLVAAGDIILDKVKKHQINLIPVDSEHNAIFQIFENQHADLIENITLTASGGPFFKNSLQDMKYITKEQAIKHPNWSMGAKISVDSATMMNKGLEVIEAYRLFPVAVKQIEVVIHPQSIIHGLVNYQDGSTLAVLSNPDMKIPISFALNYPHRSSVKHKKLNLSQIGKLDFFEVDYKKFPLLKLAYQALKSGGNAPCILNAANEIAVARFLQSEIAFTDIHKIVVEVLESLPYNNLPSLSDVIQCDNQARLTAKKIKI